MKVISIKNFGFKRYLILCNTMERLLSLLEDLKNSSIRELIESRLMEFSKFKTGDIDAIFKELCFCIMTANCSAEKCIEVHESIGNEFLTLESLELSNRFKELGYRFPNLRAKYIVEARKLKSELKEKIKIKETDHSRDDLRDWLVKNVYGLGYKEASHFLRNIGYTNYAIIDFHIIDVLTDYGIIQELKTLSKKKYFEIEAVLKEIALKKGLNLAELDLYMWFHETGKILK